VPSDAYSVINPTDAYVPLENVLRESTIDGRSLGEVAVGEIRQYRGGGEVHMDVMFDGLTIDLPERRDPITMGVTSGYDFFGGRALYVEGFARDISCANSIRSLTDRESIRHVGDVDDIRGWWDDVLGQLELVGNDLAAFVEDAMAITVDFTEMPFDFTEFYDLLGFPEYLASQAASDARANAADPFDVDMWTLHSGATYALTHCYRGREGQSLDRYVRTANDVLFNPEATIERVEAAYERSVDEGGHDEAHALASIERVGETVREKTGQFEAREEVLRERFAMDD
jgi:hypothetical protein